MSTTVHSSWVFAIAALGATFSAHATAHAHFVLQAPAGSYEQGPLGDPQKAPPCGDDGTAVITNMVTAAQAGDTITITIDETIFHPGHYRIALAINDPSELPPEPPVTPGNQACGTVPIMDPPVFPVLADGVFVHTEQFSEPQSIDITLPADVSCENCTLQIIQFMSEHGLNNPGGCFYHHCATLSIEGGAADGSTTTPGEDSAGSSGGGDDETTSAGPETGADDAATASASGVSVTDDATATAATATDPTATGTSDTDTLGVDDDDDDESGCSCSTRGGESGLGALFVLLGILGLRRRQ